LTPLCLPGRSSTAICNASVRTGYGAECTSGKLLAWGEKAAPPLRCRQPGRPRPITFTERFNRTVRREWLVQHIVETINDAQGGVTEWRRASSNDRLNIPFMVCTRTFAGRWGIGGITHALDLKMAAFIRRRHPVKIGACLPTLATLQNGGTQPDRGPVRRPPRNCPFPLPVFLRSLGAVFRDGPLRQDPHPFVITPSDAPPMLAVPHGGIPRLFQGLAGLKDARKTAAAPHLRRLQGLRTRSGIAKPVATAIAPDCQRLDPLMVFRTTRGHWPGFSAAVEPSWHLAPPVALIAFSESAWSGSCASWPARPRRGWGLTVRNATPAVPLCGHHHAPNKPAKPRHAQGHHPKNLETTPGFTNNINIAVSPLADRG